MTLKRRLGAAGTIVGFFAGVATITALYVQDYPYLPALLLIIMLAAIAYVLVPAVLPNRRLSRANRTAITNYLTASVRGMLHDFQLPIPSSIPRQQLGDELRSQSAYIALRSKVTGASIARRLMNPDAAQPQDPKEVLADLLARGQRIMLIGEPGSGKSLLCQLTFADLADTFVKTKGTSALPLYIRLDELTPAWDPPSSQAGSQPPVSTTGLHPSLAALRLLIPGLQEDALLLLVKERRLVFILDGLDELPSSRAPHQVVNRIPPQMMSFLDFPSVVSCRDNFHSIYVDADKISSRFDTNIRLLPLEYQTQIIPFVKLYCRSIRRADLIAPVTQMIERNDRLRELLSRPLMLRMTVDVVAFELEQRGYSSVPDDLLTGSDHLTADIYERYVNGWIQREHSKSDDPQLDSDEKLSLVEAIAWKIFSTPGRTNAGYGSFELSDLLITKSELADVVHEWAAENPHHGSSEVKLLQEIESRTFLVVGHRQSSFRFVHKTFFEYLLARFVYQRLCATTSLQRLNSVLSLALPDEVIDFLREILHRVASDLAEGNQREAIEQSLLRLIQQEPSSQVVGLMARQQAANLIPIVASSATKARLRTEVTPNQHPFIRRALAVGVALHDDDASLLDQFVQELDWDDTARSYHMGYNRIYYGDQPLSHSRFEDDGGRECLRFFRACIRHLELDRYKNLRPMAFASIRLMLNDVGRREFLLDRELNTLKDLFQRVNAAQPNASPQYEREREALAQSLRAAIGAT